MAVCLTPWFARSGLLRPGGAVAWSGIRDRPPLQSAHFSTHFSLNRVQQSVDIWAGFPLDQFFVRNLVAPNQLKRFAIDTEVVVLQIVPALPLLQQFFKRGKEIRRAFAGTSQFTILLSEMQTYFRLFQCCAFIYWLYWNWLFSSDWRKI